MSINIMIKWNSFWNINLPLRHN